ncbi:MAG: LytTR family DNA-binding domain-containing protein [Ignavibacteriales bacterium]|nr:LytTR family DNA-binding domain-containing protein [Ignavibacteriales bacterium]
MASKSVIRTIIVDDEEPARMVLREFLSKRGDIEIVAECANGFEAVKALTELKPDLAILDIQMPKLNGFEVLELAENPPTIIFATAYDQYAVKAFERHAVDYLLKPFSKDRLDEALKHVTEHLKKKKSLPLEALVEAAGMKPMALERVLVKDGSKVHVIPANKIDYIEAQDDYVAIKVEGKSHLKQQRMAELEKLLDPTKFVRVHRSYIVNLERIGRIELYAKDSRMAILKDGTKLLISRAGYDKLKTML